jgi:processive 1,2-diacylglycerol beta-glucosyltransferase
MKIIGISNPNSGCGYHRVINPLAYLDGERYITNFPHEDKLKEGWDIILFNRISPVDADWNKVKKLCGAKIVMDMDDDWVLPAGHINYDEYQQYKPRIENNLKIADLVTVTHERLADRCKQFNDNVVVIPNALPFGHDQYNDERLPSDEMRLFWAGGISHLKDIEILRNPMKRISQLRGIQTVIGGYSSDNQYTKAIWDRMVSAFTNSLKIRGMVLESLTVNDYMNHYHHADLMLLPLEQTTWHGMKSNLKLLEAGAKRVPVICSRVHPYLDGNPPVFYIDKQSDWFEYVNDINNNRTMLKTWGDWLHDWAKQFDLLEWNKYRKQCYQSLLKS